MNKTKSKEPIKTRFVVNYEKEFNNNYCKNNQ